MATSQGQDVISCQLCPKPVEHYCNLCRTDLCLPCLPKHMADKSRKHEVVEYNSRKEDTVVLPTCSTHEKKQCETYCQDCKIPICIKCLIDSHKKHEVTEINDILQRQKQQIIADTEELENTIVSKYRNVKSTTTTFDHDQVLSAIEEQEDKICTAVHGMSIYLKDIVTNQKKEALKNRRESQCLRNKAEKELKQMIQNNNNILKGNDATALINYQSTSNLDFQGPELPKFSCPQLFPGSIRLDQIVAMFGYLDIGNQNQFTSSYCNNRRRYTGRQPVTRRRGYIQHYPSAYMYPSRGYYEDNYFHSADTSSYPSTGYHEGIDG